jgi:DNA adenine methylase
MRPSQPGTCIIGPAVKLTAKQAARPFLKWAGGKTQLLDQLQRRLPGEIRQGEITHYLEPFVGGGAVFFAINQRYSFEGSDICDINEELVLAYTVVKRDVEALIEVLDRMEKEYYTLDEAGRSGYFYRIREIFNADKEGTCFDRYARSWVDRAAMLIFLNHTCFNGLYRVNGRGHFNVPFGRYRSPRILDAENLRLASKVLERTVIHHGDFTGCEEMVDERTFVYLDPPYRPLSSTAQFTSYHRTGFDEGDQVRLAEFIGTLDRRGAKIMLSNSDPCNEDPDDTFFDSLYAGYTIDRVSAKRTINSNAGRRGAISELVITNYPPVT